MASLPLETILTSIFMIAASVVAIVGNFLVILAILWNRRLRTVCNFLLLNLAVADLLQGAIAVPLRLVDQLNQTGQSKALVPCLIVIPLTVFLFGASNFNLTLISLDRYLALSRPFLYPTLTAPRRVASVITMSWLLIFIIAFLPIMGWGASNSANTIDICLYYTTLSKEYLFMLFSVVNLAVIIVLAFTNYFILKTAIRQIRRINIEKSHGSQVEGPSSIYKDDASNIEMTLHSTQYSSTVDGHRAREPRPTGGRERRATKIVVIIVGIFVFLTTPITVIDIISLLGCPACTPLTVVKITVLMAYANGCINVFIYAGFNAEMRSTWVSIYNIVKEKVIRCFRC